jgi:hypothetical protein
MSNVLFEFVSAPCPGNRNIKSCGLRPSGNFIKDVELVRRWYTQIVRKMQKSKKTVFVDLGHQLALGWLKPLAAVLGRQMTVVRLRRSRYLTAASFAVMTSDMKEKYIIRPEFHGDDYLRTLFPHDEEKFRKLPLRAKYFLWVDEVEAQWFHLKRMYQETIDICPFEANYVSLSAATFQLLPHILGFGKGVGILKNRHGGNRPRIIDDSSFDDDRRYREALAPNASETVWITGAQF